MKRSGTLRHLFWLEGFIVLLAACTSPPAQSTRISPSPTVQSAQASPAPAQPVRQLKPNAPVPASCPATPVNIGGPFGTESPWLQAQPTVSGIVAYLAYSGVSQSLTYRLPHTDGFFPGEGLYTKTLHDTGNAMWGPGLPTDRNMHTYTSYLQAPSVGCWRLQITSGQARGAITMWFMG